MTSWDLFAPLRALADAGRLRTTVEESGLTIRRTQAVSVSWPYTSAWDYVDVEIDRPGPRGDFFRSLPAPEREHATDIAAQLLQPFRNGGGYVVPGETLNVLAIRLPDVPQAAGQHKS